MIKHMTKFLTSAVLINVAAFAIAVGTAGANTTGADVSGVGGGSINFGGPVKFITFAFSAHTGRQGDFGSFRFTIERARRLGGRAPWHLRVRAVPCAQA
jgi:hypothetical protein